MRWPGSRDQAILAAAEALSAPLEGDTGRPLGVTAAALQEHLARHPDDGPIYQRLLPAADPVIQADTVAEVLRAGLPLPFESLPSPLRQAIDPATPLPTAYRMLRESERNLRRGAACGFWLALLRRHGDREELARLAERLRPAPVGVADLPWQVRRGLAHLAERRAAPLLARLELEWPRFGLTGVAVRCHFARALDSEAWARMAWDEARRWVDEARRSNAADRSRRLAAAAAQAVGASAVLEVLAPAEGEQAEAWTTALLERLAEASTAWAARAVALARRGQWSEAVAVADSRIASWLHRAEALTAMARLARDDPAARDALLAVRRPAELEAVVTAALRPEQPGLAGAGAPSLASWRRLSLAAGCGVPGAGDELTGWLESLQAQPDPTFARLAAGVWHDVVRPGAERQIEPAMAMLAGWLESKLRDLVRQSHAIYDQAVRQSVEAVRTAPRRDAAPPGVGR